MKQRSSSSVSNESSVVPTNEELLEQIQSEARAVVQDEPVLCGLLKTTILHETSRDSLEDLLANTICYRLFHSSSSHHAVCPVTMCSMFYLCLMDQETLEMGHTMMEAIKNDILAVCQRDPAMDSPLQVVLFSKGFAALVCHRAAYRLYHTKRTNTTTATTTPCPAATQQSPPPPPKSQKFTALYLQSQASAAFGVDIHPNAQLGQRLMLDHGTGIVIGETAVVGDGCTFLHGVTLGGTGKEHGDRHPKVGQNVLIGANASLLGNIRIGNRVKIGAGSVVLRSIPDGATAVGVPAKIIGKSNETKPGSDMDETLSQVSLFRQKSSDLESMVVTTVTNLTTTTTSDNNSQEGRGYYESSDPALTDDDHSWDDPTCPYRSYAAMAKRAPRGSFTMCTLHSLLLKEGCTATEIGSCFFALDVDNKGYISTEDFHERGYEALVSNTRIPSEQVNAIVNLYWADIARRREAPGRYGK